MATDLHRHLLQMGVESKFAYGWGEKGGKSRAEDDVQDSFQVGHRLQVASNILIHRVIGIDVLRPAYAERKKLIDAIDWADIVHLHVIHSYFLPFRWLIKELVFFGKPVVWTAHDYWMLTGRCASIENCNTWLEGCGSCETNTNYPASFLDFSASEFIEKRHQLDLLSRQLHIVAPSKFVSQRVTSGLPKIAVKHIPNWINSGFEGALKEVQFSRLPIELSAKKIVIIIVASDLSDKTKVNRQVVNELLKCDHVELHTIGQNSSFQGDNVLNKGRITNRKQMVEAVSMADAALFTSEKDTFGLVMIEALSCGVPVFAIDSPASSEVLSALGLNSVASYAAIYDFVKNSHLPECYEGLSPATLSRRTIEQYNGRVMAKQYLDLYNDIIELGKKNDD